MPRPNRPGPLALRATPRPAGVPGGWVLRKFRRTVDEIASSGLPDVDLKLLQRCLEDFVQAFKTLAPYRGKPKVTIFGSARTPTDHPAFRQAESFAREISRRGYLVITGAGGGIMEAGHRGAGRDKSIGINIRLPFEQGANPVIAGDRKLVTMKYFFTRKLLFVKETSALVCLPGGFGSQDETFEVLTLIQTGKSYPMPVILLDAKGGGYWRSWDRFIRRLLLAQGYISEEDVSLYKITDDVGVAVREITDFYKVYHSLRYVGDTLVLRLKRAPSRALVRSLNDEFRDILTDGSIEPTAPLPEEASEPSLERLPRLRLQFDRIHSGRLRRLIDRINRG
ncbi:MAG: LOG family protein [Planctomycetota bacterium]